MFIYHSVDTPLASYRIGFGPPARNRKKKKKKRKTIEDGLPQKIEKIAEK